jgi:membrane-bound lytic murein transglycosylase D
VQRWEQTYARSPERLRHELERILPLMALVLDELDIHHLPGEFALLPIVESWSRPAAGSPGTAYGLWQFTSATARGHGLRIAPGVDQRLAPQAATRAAMRYLAGLQNRFGDWRLASMAFNAGEYRLARALSAARAPDRRASAAEHWPPGLSMTTYEHLAKVQALACLIVRPERFGLELPATVPFDTLREAPFPARLGTLDEIAARAEIEPGRLRALNPGLTGGGGSDPRRRMLVPASALPRLQALQDLPSTSSTPAVVTPAASGLAPREHRVKRGDTLSGIARHYRLTLAQLLQWNRIDPRALLRPGQRLQLEP